MRTEDRAALPPGEWALPSSHDRGSEGLLSNAQFSDDIEITLGIITPNVIQQASASADQAKQASPEPGFEAGADEVWERIRYFLEYVVPVAEGAGVKLACHHDDPPVPTLKGETRVLGSLEGMKRLVEMVPSEANGLNFCQGTVTEMGVDVIEAIRYFGSRGKIHHVHFRNVKGSIPRFDESFIDDGDVDMLEAMRTYKEVGYRGTIMPDHTPKIVGDTAWGHRGRAFALGYMKALMKAVGALEE